MMGFDIAALMGLFGLTGLFATLGAVLAGWMAWRIVEKAGIPGWVGLGAVLLTLTGIGSIVPLILLWVFAYMRWPRDQPAVAYVPGSTPPQPGSPPGSPSGSPPQQARLAGPMGRLEDHRSWRLSGSLSNGEVLILMIDQASGGYILTGAAANAPNELSVSDPSIGRPHARLLTAGKRLGIEDLGSAGGTWVDGARLQPEHGPRDVTQARTVRLGNVEFVLSHG
jgi:hypothetical protein